MRPDKHYRLDRGRRSRYGKEILSHRIHISHVRRDVRLGENIGKMVTETGIVVMGSSAELASNSAFLTLVGTVLAPVIGAAVGLLSRTDTQRKQEETEHRFRRLEVIEKTIAVGHSISDGLRINIDPSLANEDYIRILNTLAEPAPPKVSDKLPFEYVRLPMRLFLLPQPMSVSGWIASFLFYTYGTMGIFIVVFAALIMIESYFEASLSNDTIEIQILPILLGAIPFIVAISFFRIWAVRAAKTAIQINYQKYAQANGLASAGSASSTFSLGAMQIVGGTFVLIAMLGMFIFGNNSPGASTAQSQDGAAEICTPAALAGGSCDTLSEGNHIASSSPSVSTMEPCQQSDSNQLACIGAMVADSQMKCNEYVNSVAADRYGDFDSLSLDQNIVVAISKTYSAQLNEYISNLNQKNNPNVWMEYAKIVSIHHLCTKAAALETIRRELTGGAP